MFLGILQFIFFGRNRPEQAGIDRNPAESRFFCRPFIFKYLHTVCRQFGGQDRIDPFWEAFDPFLAKTNGERPSANDQGVTKLSPARFSVRFRVSFSYLSSVAPRPLRRRRPFAFSIHF